MADCSVISPGLTPHSGKAPDTPGPGCALDTGLARGLVKLSSDVWCDHVMMTGGWGECGLWAICGAAADCSGCSSMVVMWPGPAPGPGLAFSCVTLRPPPLRPPLPSLHTSGLQLGISKLLLHFIHFMCVGKTYHFRPLHDLMIWEFSSEL